MINVYLVAPYTHAGALAVAVFIHKVIQCVAKAATIRETICLLAASISHRIAPHGMNLNEDLSLSSSAAIWNWASYSPFRSASLSSAPGLFMAI